jgi:hypothetical protein
VNGRKASFSDTTISWTTNEAYVGLPNSTMTTHWLERLAGTYRSGVAGMVYAEPPPTFMCEKAHPAKF